MSRGSISGCSYSFRLNDYEGEIISLAFILFVLAGLVLSPLIFVVVAHEGLHALVAKLFGARIESGISVFGKINLAFYIAVRTPLRKRGWVYVIIAPVLLSIIAYILAFTLQSPWWGIVFVFNTSGLAGDLLILLIISNLMMLYLLMKDS